MLDANNTADMIAFLRSYLRMRTTYPDPHYKEVLQLFQQQAEAYCLAYQEIFLPSGNPVGIVSYYGQNPGLPALALNHHMDVVPAPNSDEWIRPPFEGHILQDSIIGRGAQDLKGVGVVHYFALRQLKRDKVVLQRTVHLFIVPDEERGGFQGMKEFMATAEFKKLAIGLAIIVRFLKIFDQENYDV